MSGENPVCEKYKKLISCVSQVQSELIQLEKMIHEVDLEVYKHLDEPIKGTLLERTNRLLHYLIAIYQLAGVTISTAEEVIRDYTLEDCEVEHVECVSET
jgi:transposase